MPTRTNKPPRRVSVALERQICRRNAHLSKCSETAPSGAGWSLPIVVVSLSGRIQSAEYRAPIWWRSACCLLREGCCSPVTEVAQCRRCRIIAYMTRRLVLFLVFGGLIAGCSSPVALPDRTDPAVQAEEARLAVLLETRDDNWIPQPRECSVRLLGQEGDTSYVWAFCQGPDEIEEGEHPAESLPLRIDGDQVSEPRDGSLGDDIEEMFPADLAAAILDNDPRIFP